MKDLSDIRGEIDSIDTQLAGLLKRRLDIVGEVAAAKREKGVPVTEAGISTRFARRKYSSCSSVSTIARPTPRPWQSGRTNTVNRLLSVRLPQYPAIPPVPTIRSLSQITYICRSFEAFINSSAE